MAGGVVAADAAHERFDRTQLDQQKFSEAWQALVMVRDHDIDFQLVGHRGKPLQEAHRRIAGI